VLRKRSIEKVHLAPPAGVSEVETE
jgi:hypothetical protein